MNEGFHESWQDAFGGTPKTSLDVATLAETSGTSSSMGQEGAPDKSLCQSENAGTSHQKFQVISQ